MKKATVVLLTALPFFLFGEKREADANPTKRGIASWHNYTNDKTVKKEHRRGHITASRSYPCGTVIKVMNASNPSKFVIVTVRDWGPAKWTGRVLDLNKNAFSKLANPSQGTVSVKYQILRRGGKCVHRH